MENDIQLCLDAGMNSHISKPVEEQDMLNKMLAQLTVKNQTEQ